MKTARTLSARSRANENDGSALSNLHRRIIQMTPETYTLGIEEEFQIVDPQTRELRSHVSEMLEEGRMLLGEKIKPEMIQAQIEVGTGVCSNIQEARADISRLRSIISYLAQKKGLAIVA